MSTENQDIVFPETAETRMYLNVKNEIVIRQINCDNHFVIIPLIFAQAVIDRITYLKNEAEAEG